MQIGNVGMTNFMGMVYFDQLTEQKQNEKGVYIKGSEEKGTYINTENMHLRANGNGTTIMTSCGRYTTKIPTDQVLRAYQVAASAPGAVQDVNTVDEDLAKQALEQQKFETNVRRINRSKPLIIVDHTGPEPDRHKVNLSYLNPDFAVKG